MSTEDDLFLGVERHNKKFAKLCEPMMRYFSLASVSYMNIKNNGELLNLHTDIKWMERCMEEKYYRNDPGMVSPSNIESGFTFMDAYQGKEYTDIMLRDAVENFNFHSGCSYVEKNKNNYQLFGIGSLREGMNFSSKIVIEMPILKRFIRSIQLQLQNDRKVLESSMVDFSQIKGQLFHEQQGIMSSTVTERNSKLSSLGEVGFCSDNILDISLTSQEKNCLRLYLEHNTMKQIAKHMSLSPKTVSWYFDAIRGKMGCGRKDDLLKNVEILVCLGVL